MFSIYRDIRQQVYERILVEIVVFERGWVTLSANFRGNWAINDCLRQKNRVGVFE